MPRWLRRLWYVITLRRADTELREEIETHRSLREASLRRESDSSGDPVQASRRALGNIALAREDVRDIWVPRAWDRVSRDVRLTCRQLRRSPGFVLTTILTLAVGIGANTTLFSIADAVLFNPLGFIDQERLVIAGEDAVEPRAEISYQDFLQWRVRTRTFDRMEAVMSGNWSYKVAAGDPAPVEYRPVSAGFFDLLGIRPALGRSFSGQDDRKGAPRVVIISHGLWQGRFGGDPGIVGRVVQLEEFGSFTGAPAKSFPAAVVGVMPATFTYPPGAEMWTPLVPALADIVGPNLPDFVDDPAAALLYVVGRMTRDVTVSHAARDLTRIAGDLATERKDEDPDGVRVTPLLDDLLGTTGISLRALLGASGLLLLVGCANVAGLLLVRAGARQRELAIKVALGASARALSRQMLVECMVLVAAGSAAALMLAKVALPLAVSLIPTGVPRVDAAAIDARVIAFTGAAAVLTTLLCWMAPALTAGRVPIAAIRGADRAVAFGGLSRHARKLFVIAELGVAVLILTCAGLLFRSVLRVNTLDLGFQPSNLATVFVERAARYTGDPRAVRQYVDDVRQALARLPGVQDAAAVGPRGLATSVTLEGQTPEDATSNPLATITIVSPTYFSTMGMALRSGRLFDDGDRTASTQVAIVNESFAGRMWAGASPVGKRFKMPMPLSERNARKDEWWTVVGLAPDVRLHDFSPVTPLMYVPDRQSVFPVSSFVVRTAASLSDMAQPLRRVLQEFNPGAFVAVTPVEEDLARIGQPWRANLAVFGSFAALTLLLAIVGLYATLSSIVAEHSREIGIKLALGATPRRVLREMMSKGATLVGVGLAVGVTSAFAATRVIRSLLFEVSALDAPTLAAAPLVLLVVAGLACVIPARRAARVDPLTTLKTE